MRVKNRSLLFKMFLKAAVISLILIFAFCLQAFSSSFFDVPGEDQKVITAFPSDVILPPTVFTAFPSARITGPEELSVYAKEAKELTEIDLDYWFTDIYVENYSEGILNATKRVGYPGPGYCATWVGNVYQAAGLGYVSGNASDMWRIVCNSTNSAEIEEGMIIAVRYSKLSDAGMIYGHCGIIVKNPSYEGTDVLEETEPLYRRILNLEKILSYHVDHTTEKEIRAEIRKIKEKLKPYEAVDTDIYYYVDGRLIQADSNGHEKWLVIDSTDCISTSTLSNWLSRVDASSTAAWGWGHKYYGIYSWVVQLN